MPTCKQSGCNNTVKLFKKYCDDCLQVQTSAPSESDLIVTTAPFIDGYRVTRTIDVITAENFIGMSIFKDCFAGVRDVLGGRVGSAQKILRQARIESMGEMKKEAFNLGANAIIGVDIDYSEFSGGNKSMLFMVISGTAVTVEPIVIENASLPPDNPTNEDNGSVVAPEATVEASQQDTINLAEQDINDEEVENLHQLDSEPVFKFEKTIRNSSTCL